MPKDYQLTVAVQRQVTVTELVTIRLNHKQCEEIAGEEIISDTDIGDIFADRAVEILKVRHQAGDEEIKDYKERDAKEAALGCVGIDEIQAPNRMSYDFSSTMVLDSRTGYPFGRYREDIDAGRKSKREGK